MSSADSSVKQVYRLGRITFTVRNCQADFEQEISQLLPHATTADMESDRVREINMGCEQNLRELINHVLKRHAKCIWMDAACVISPQGQKVLMSGGSHAGKSTTSLALALGYGWKVLAEDITLFDPIKDEIINFASPFSLKQGAADLLQASLGVSPQPIVLNEWLAMGSLNAGRNFRAPLELALHLELNEHKRDPLVCSPMTPSEYFRKIIPYSNVVLLKDGTDKLIEYLSKGGCYQISGGSLSERLEKIFELCKQY